MNKENYDKNEVRKFINEFLPDDKKISRDNTENLANFIIKMNEIYSNYSKSQENIDSAKYFLNVAKQDLQSSQILLRQGIYAQSVFHLQQAVEKTMKAYGLSFYFLNESDLKGRDGIGHITPLAFVKMVEKEWVDPLLDIFKSFYPGLNLNIDNFKGVIKKNKNEVARLNKSQIERLLKVNTNIKKKIKKKGINQEIQFKLDEIAEIVSPLLEEYPTVSDGIEEIRKKFKIEFILSLLDLYLLSIITYPHFNYTRYPDLEIKPEEYKNLGITKSNIAISEKIENSIKMLENYLKVS